MGADELDQHAHDSQQQGSTLEIVLVGDGGAALGNVDRMTEDMTKLVGGLNRAVGPALRAAVAAAIKTITLDDIRAWTSYAGYQLEGA